MADSYYASRQSQLKAKSDANERKVAGLSRQEKNLKADIEKRKRMLSGAIGRQYEYDAKRRNAIAKGRTHKSYDEKLRTQKAKAGLYSSQIRRDEEKLKRVQFKRAEAEKQRIIGGGPQIGYDRQKVRFILAVEYKGDGTRHVEVEIIINSTAEYLSTVTSMPFKIAGVYLDKFYGQKLVAVAKDKGQLGEHRYPPHESYYSPETAIKMAIEYKDYDNPKNDRSFPETEITSMQGALEYAKRVAS